MLCSDPGEVGRAVLGFAGLLLIGKESLDSGANRAETDLVQGREGILPGRTVEMAQPLSRPSSLITPYSRTPPWQTYSTRLSDRGSVDTPRSESQS